MVVELRRGGAPPDEEEDELPARDQVLRREQRDEQHEAVDLGARREEGHLVAQPEQREQAEQHGDPGRVEPDALRVAVGDDQEDAGREHGGVQRDVEAGAAEAARQRHLVGPRRQSDGAGPQPVEDAADRRREAQRQHHRARAEPEHLPDERPDRELLEDDRLAPPVAEVAQPAQAGGRRADHDEPAHEVDRELDDVEHVDDARRAEPVHGPVLRVRLQPRQERLSLPLLQVERRRRRREERHLVAHSVCFSGSTPGSSEICHLVGSRRAPSEPASTSTSREPARAGSFRGSR